MSKIVLRKEVRIMRDSKWTIKVTSKGQVTLPKHMRDIMVVREGDYLEAVLKDDALVLTKKLTMSSSEQMRLYAGRQLAALGYGDMASRAALEPRRVRESLPALPDMAQRVREDREKQ
jgi:AbrB family looped-hinge helix DNA binding protein